MMLRRLRLFFLMALPPGGVAVWAGLTGPDAVLLAAAGYAAVLAGIAAFVFRTPRDVRALAAAAAGRERELVLQRDELQARVEFLSAEREISLVLNEDVDFRTIFDRVLAITCDTLGGDAELWMLDGEKLLLRAARTDGRTVFDQGRREDRRVRQCFDGGRILFEAEGGRFHALAPLQADREIIGVVRISTPLEGSAEARQERTRLLAQHLQEFSKFLALALKTPDLYTRAVQDGLTGLWTKRHFLSQGRLFIESARRYGEPLSLIMIDVDHFKRVNDTHGHQAGDKVLKGVAEILKKKVRGGSAFRYGGEEMAILLPKTDLERAAQAAERLRKSIEAHKIAGIRVTVSLGVAQLDGSMEDAGAFVEKADGALYRAKEGGRNRVVRAPRPGNDQEPTRRYTRSA